MRLDDFLSTVGIVPRRTEAKRLADAGMVEVNGRAAKAAMNLKAGDLIAIKGSTPARCEVLALPVGSVKKESRAKFVRILTPA